eukprot:30635-Alexandrium_andersonii.AAC.1
MFCKEATVTSCRWTPRIPAQALPRPSTARAQAPVPAGRWLHVTTATARVWGLASREARGKGCSLPGAHQQRCCALANCHRKVAGTRLPCFSLTPSAWQGGKSAWQGGES